jgi:hypothetical protein
MKLSSYEAKVVLDWYYTCSDFCLGYKSSFGAFLTALETGVLPGSYYQDPEGDIQEGYITSAGRAARIRRVLIRCSPSTQTAVRAYFTPAHNRYPAPLRAFFAEYAPLVSGLVGTPAAMSLVSRGHSEEAYQLRTRVQTIFRSALEEFCHAWSLTDDR